MPSPRRAIEVVESGAAAERLAAAEAFLDGVPADGEVVVVAASRDAADELARRITRRRRAAVGLHRFTLTQLAARLAAPATSAARLAPCTPLGAHAVAARAAFDALAAGRIPYFAPVARTPGFTLTLATTLAELRAAGLDAAALAAAPAPADQLATILAGYEAQLVAAGLADRAALFAAATAAVAAAPADPLVGLPLLLLDLALDSRCERAFATSLVAAAPRALATVPAGDPSPWRVRRTRRPARPAAHDSLTRLQTYLFAEGAPPAAAADDSLQLFSAPGEAREAVEIARRVLAEARAGTPFDRMAVFLRSPETYAALLEAAFRRAGVPAWFARGTRRPNPAGRAFLALLACAAERLSAQRFAEYLSLAQVPLDEAPAAPWTPPRDEALPAEPATPAPAATGEEDAPERGVLASPWKWEALLVEAAVIGGSERWARRLAGLDAELALRQAELQSEEPDAPAVAGIERARTQLAELRRFALPLIERLAALPERAPWGEWLAALDELAARGLRTPTGVRAVLAELAPMATVGPVGLDEVRDVLRARLTTLSDEPPADRYGRLLVTTLDDARGCSAAVVFVPGVAERLFPQRPREDPLLLDAARAALSPDLPTQETRLGRERLRLRLAVGAAERRVVLSYPRADVIQGRPRVISFYGLDVARAARGRMPDVEAFEREAVDAGGARLAWPAPADPDRAIDGAEHDLAVIGTLLHQTPATKRPRGAVQYLLELNPHLGRSLRTRYQRWEDPRWWPVDGLTAPGDAARDYLAKQRLTERPYSPSALQHFAACPYRFFLAAIQRLESRLEAAPLEQLDPLTRGKLIHRVQAETLRALATAGALPLTTANLAAAERQLVDTLGAVARDEEENLAPPSPRIWKDEIDALRGDLVTWLRLLAERGDAWQPLHVEYGFGLPADPSRDPASRRAPAVVGDGLQLRGSVDLVERHRDGSVRVIDHKTGANFTKADLIVGGGEVLQPVLYALAVEAALGVPVRDARLWFCTSRGDFAERVVPFDPRSRTAALDVLAIIDRAIVAGRFPPAPREGACAHCDFRPVCGPYEEERVRRKEPLPELAALRGRP